MVFRCSTTLRQIRVLYGKCVHESQKNKNKCRKKMKYKSIALEEAATKSDRTYALLLPRPRRARSAEVTLVR